MESPDKLPFRVFDAASKLADEKKAEIQDALRDLRYMEQSKMSPENRKLILKLTTNYSDWGQKYLGINLSERMPDITKIHILQKNSEGGKKMLEKHPELGEADRMMGGADTDTDEVIVWEDRIEGGVTSTLNHELTHVLGRKSLIVKKDEDNKLMAKMQNSAYSNVNSNRKQEWGDEIDFPILGLNEMMTETINIEVLQHLKKTKGKQKNDYIEGDFGYHRGVIFLDMVIEEIVRRTKEDEEDARQKQEEIRKKLYAGYFKGQMAELRVLKNVFGLEALQWLAKLQPNDLGLNLILKGEYMFGLDMHAYFKETRAYETGKVITLSNGIKIKKQTSK